MAQVRRYSVRAWVSYDVYEGETVEEAQAEVERTLDADGIGEFLCRNAYVGVDPDDTPELEDEIMVGPEARG